MNWHDTQDVFERDGSWRDIYVLNAGFHGWDALWSLIQTPPHAIGYWVDGEPTPFPDSVQSAFALPNNPLLGVSLENIQLNCHFFNGQDIEFDLDPSDVTTQAHMDLVLGFMRRLGRAASSNVILTPENTPEHPDIVFELLRDSFVRRPQPTYNR